MTTPATPDTKATPATKAAPDTTALPGQMATASPTGARIIPFPARVGGRPQAAPGAASSRPRGAQDPAARDAQERLARALASLDSALTEQRTAMAGWRESLDQLRKATTGLGLSMQRYHRTLGKLGSDVSELHAEAVRLERWADNALTRSTLASDTGPAAAKPAVGQE